MANGGPAMDAVLYDSFGGPEVLYVDRVPRPEPTKGEVLVQVHAVSVNGGDIAARSGHARVVTGRTFPQRVGLDFSGVIAQVGSGVSQFAPGDRVWG